jgi:phosphatidylinositol-4,5-bisphosphate 4-phosphatase
LRAAGLDQSWASGKALSARDVNKVLDKAQEFRVNAKNASDRSFQAFMGGTGQPSLVHRFSQMATAHGYPATDAQDPKLHMLIRKEIRQDPQYAKRTLSPADLDTIAQRAITKFYSQKQAGFREQHPGLAQFVQNHPGGMPREDNRSFAFGLMTKLNPLTAGGHPLSTEPQAFRDLARDALKEVHGTTSVLGKSAYEPTAMRQLEQELLAKHAQLLQLEQAILALAPPDVPGSPEGQDLQQQLVADIRHQLGLLQAKAGFLDDTRDNNPLSQKAVAYSNLLWAQAAGHIFDQAITELTNNPPPDGSGPAKIQQLQLAKNAHIQHRTQAYTQASRTALTEAPTEQNKHTHPAVLGKVGTEAHLRTELGSAGFDQATIDRLTSKASLGAARREALNQNPDWAPIERNMVVTKDGVTRTYKSRITPGADISPRFARRYAQNVPQGPGVPGHAPRQGIASSEKADHYHARNLKVSELERTDPGGGPPTTIAKVIGHGVLDMWDIEDPGERSAANERGAHEVLEAAITTNDRVRTTALNRAQAGNPNPPGPVKITHVSVNLTTPSPWRELPGLKSTDKLHDYQELTYTQEQFRAFGTHSSSANGGAPTQFQIDDTRPGGGLGQDANIDVEVETITFSFGINPLATHMTGSSAVKGGAVIGGAIGGAIGTIVPIAGNIAGAIVGAGVGALVGALDEEAVQNFVGGWDKVYEHNRGEMIKFVGDLGTGKEGSAGSAPGGFIGSVYDRLDPNIPDQAELMGKIRDQTSLVRSMFTNEDFRRGNGDPAKMGREILGLQAYAEEALALMGVDDQAATSSKGCKSDKDRGGVTDVELKHKLITEDMGGVIRPDQRLEAEDQANYYVIATGSGQLENQSLNTGLPGSKEAGKLKERIPDLQVRSYLAGLGAFASE